MVPRDTRPKGDSMFTSSTWAGKFTKIFLLCKRASGCLDYRRQPWKPVKSYLELSQFPDSRRDVCGFSTRNSLTKPLFLHEWGNFERRLEKRHYYKENRSFRLFVKLIKSGARQYRLKYYQTEKEADVLVSNLKSVSNWKGLLKDYLIGKRSI